MAAHIIAGLLITDRLHHEGCSFVEAPQDILALFINHVMDTTVIDVTGSHLDGPGHGRIVQQGKQGIQTAPDGSGVVIELEQVGRLPVENFFFSGQETAEQFPMGQGGQHLLISPDVFGMKGIQNHHHIQITGLCRFPTAVAAL